MERVSAKWSSRIVENWLPPEFKRGIASIRHRSVMIALLVCVWQRLDGWTHKRTRIRAPG
jgi:hypothetical protein